MTAGLVQTMSNHDKIRDTLLQRFHRRGGPTAMTADFRSFPAERQKAISEAAHLSAQEMPILLSWRDDHGWLLLTNRRILWKNGLTVEALKGAEIEAILSPATPAAAAAAITLTTNRGRRVDLPVEADKIAYGAMHNVLSFIAAAAKQR
jgi:hypothetical protein